MCDLINTHTYIQIYPEGVSQKPAAVDNRCSCSSSLPGGLPAAPFPFRGALSPVWPWWDFLGWGRWHGSSLACSGQQRSSKHDSERAQLEAGLLVAERCGLAATQLDNLTPSIEDSGMNPAAFSCFAPTYDFFQPIPANSSRCAVPQRSPWPAGALLCDGMFCDERGGGLTRQPVGPFGGTATMTTAMNTNRVDPGSFSSRCCAFRRTHEERRPCSAALYPTSFTLDSLLALTIYYLRPAQDSWPAFTPDSMACGGVFV